jgi:hypothetical protein
VIVQVAVVVVAVAATCLPRNNVVDPTVVVDDGEEKENVVH